MMNRRKGKIGVVGEMEPLEVYTVAVPCPSQFLARGLKEGIICSRVQDNPVHRWGQYDRSAT
jgi:hypothetical protein